MKRGAIVVAAFSGDYGKLRPALIVQDDAFDTLDTIVLCPITTHIRPSANVRIPVKPTLSNGLRAESQIAIDKITVLPQRRIGSVIGEVDDALMAVVSRSLVLFLRLG